jgi:capsular exopolysaccharide synthesis family protein
VILVDADLRRPTLHRLLQVEQAPGLSDLLLSRASLEEALQESAVEGLRVVASGLRPPDPAELLNSARMGELIRQLGSLADIVLFDTPPCIPVTDAQVLATRVDGVVLVLEVGVAKKAALRHAKGLFDQAHARSLGLVFNKVGPGTIHGYDYDYASGAGYYTEDPAPEPPDGSCERRHRALAPVLSAHGLPDDPDRPSHGRRNPGRRSELDEEL